MMSQKTICKTEFETWEVSHSLADKLVPGDVVLLTGTLGAGKTTFVKGVVESLGGNGAEVTSPTFTLVKTYQVTSPVIKRVYHVDLYRLKKEEQETLALADVLEDAEGIVLVEWAEKLSSDTPIGTYRVSIKHLKDDSREITASEIRKEGRADRLK